MLGTLERHFAGKVLPPIRTDTRAREAPSEGKTLFEYAPRSRAASDYRAAAEWVHTHPALP